MSESMDPKKKKMIILIIIGVFSLAAIILIGVLGYKHFFGGNKSDDKPAAIGNGNGGGGGGNAITDPETDEANKFADGKVADINKAEAEAIKTQTKEKWDKLSALEKLVATAEKMLELETYKGMAEKIQEAAKAYVTDMNKVLGEDKDIQAFIAKLKENEDIKKAGDDAAKKKTALKTFSSKNKGEYLKALTMLIAKRKEYFSGDGKNKILADYMHPFLYLLKKSQTVLLNTEINEEAQVKQFKELVEKEKIIKIFKILVLMDKEKQIAKALEGLLPEILNVSEFNVLFDKIMVEEKPNPSPSP